SADVLRSLVLVALSVLILFGFNKERLTQNITIILIGVLMVGDLFLVDKNYVNKDSFVDSRLMNEPFQKTPIDKLIDEDQSVYRVFEKAGAMSNARTSYRSEEHTSELQS